MEWLDHFNNSIAYVEENLARSIDLTGQHNWRNVPVIITSECFLILLG